MKYIVIAENDHSQWNDDTGKTYHFPKRYLKYLEKGTKIVYYKGKITDKSFSAKRLSTEPHYFGIGEVGNLYPDTQSAKKDHYAEIVNFVAFDKAISFKKNDVYLETIPETKLKNYWRDGVRPIDKVTYEKIINLAGVYDVINDAKQGSDGAYTSKEGNSKQVFVTKYERDTEIRSRAIEIHGTVCMACTFDFKKVYGAWGDGFIHIHHVKPLSNGEGERVVNPKTDMIVLCPNCHSMVHRRRDKTLNLTELIALIANARSDRSS